jgi:hypothetical protein
MQPEFCGVLISQLAFLFWHLSESTFWSEPKENFVCCQLLFCGVEGSRARPSLGDSTCDQTLVLAQAHGCLLHTLICLRNMLLGVWGSQGRREGG